MVFFLSPFFFDYKNATLFVLSLHCLVCLLVPFSQASCANNFSSLVALSHSELFSAETKELELQ